MRITVPLTNVRVDSRKVAVSIQKMVVGSDVLR